jgi:hypothetical protein
VAGGGGEQQGWCSGGQGWRGSGRGASGQCGEARGRGNWGRGGSERGAPRRTESDGGWRSPAHVGELVWCTRDPIERS